MIMALYSKTTNAFYLESNKEDYKREGVWPDDLIKVSIDILNEFSGTPPNGKIRVAGENGMPVWGDIPPLTHDELIHLADEEKRRLISYASNVINHSMWQTKLQLGRITDDEKRQLNLWLDYIDAVNAIDTSTAPNIKWPTPPVDLAK
ncbi:MAG: tail fiber assembly protein [Plesiomonas shigelloides]